MFERERESILRDYNHHNITLDPLEREKESILRDQREKIFVIHIGIFILIINIKISDNKEIQQCAMLDVSERESILRDNNHHNITLDPLERERERESILRDQREKAGGSIMVSSKNEGQPTFSFSASSTSSSSSSL